MFNSKQIETLEKVFEQTHYPDSNMREQLSKSLCLDAIRIPVWFQNRRAKFKKMDSINNSKSSKFNQTFEFFNKKLKLLSNLIFFLTLF